MRVLFKTKYLDDIRLIKHSGYAISYGLLLVVALLLPQFLGEFYIGELAQVFIFAIAGVGLMILTGYTGQVSLGHAAFLAIGAYAHVFFLEMGLPFMLSFILAGLISAAVGGLLAIPVSRLSGLYLAIATLGFAIIVEDIAKHWSSVTGGLGGKMVPAPKFFGHEIWTAWEFYYLCLAVLILIVLATLNLLRTPTGRAFVAIRDSETSARCMGVNVARYKTSAFAISAAFTGFAGALLAHRLSYISPDIYNIITSIQLLMMVVVGGLGSIHGAIFGAVFIGVLPQALAISKDFLPLAISQTPGLEPGVFGLILILFIIYDPQGLYGRWLKIKLFFDIFPLYRKSTFKKQKSYTKTERLR